VVGQTFSSLVIPPPPFPLLPCRSQITIYLKEKCKEFAKPARVKEIIKKYSNFVNFPIKVRTYIYLVLSFSFPPSLHPSFLFSAKQALGPACLSLASSSSSLAC